MQWSNAPSISSPAVDEENNEIMVRVSALWNTKQSTNPNLQHSETIVSVSESVRKRHQKQPVSLIAKHCLMEKVAGKNRGETDNPVQLENGRWNGVGSLPCSHESTATATATTTTTATCADVNRFATIPARQHTVNTLSLNTHMETETTLGLFQAKWASSWADLLSRRPLWLEFLPVRPHKVSFELVTSSDATVAPLYNCLTKPTYLSDRQQRV